jgi:hypothetical protein
MKRPICIAAGVCAVIGAGLFFIFRHSVFKKPVHPLNLVDIREYVPYSGPPDILSYAEAHPRFGWNHVHYGDAQLSATEGCLGKIRPRPWTVPDVLEWYRGTTDEVIRIHLL